MIPTAPSRPDAGWASARAADPVVRRYRAFVAVLDWEVVVERDARRPWPGRPPHPVRASSKLRLVKLGAPCPAVTQVRACLVEHPLLVRELGCRPGLDPRQPWGCAVARTGPCDRWLRQPPPPLDPGVLAARLAGTVRALAGAIPELGTTVAVDGKPIDAWGRETKPNGGVRPSPMGA